MVDSPDDALREDMRQAGLNPPDTIHWDRKIHRFPAPGEKKSRRGGGSWYRAFPDRKGAVYGCYKTGLDQQTWQASWGRPDDLDDEEWAEVRAEWAREQKKREQERRNEAEQAAELCRARWKKAIDPSPEHPYLVAKGIQNPVGIRQEGELLLVPCKSMEDNRIRSLQTITPEGDKLFVEGGEVGGTRMTLNTGRLNPTGRIYITEGWATGHSIHTVMGEPVIVAFSAGNLAEVVRGTVDRWADRYPELRFIIAADNDRWTRVRRDGEWHGNPGLVFATEAAEVYPDRVDVVLPDFESLEGEPTDFNDLMVREGENAVRYFLDPRNRPEATTDVDSHEEKMRERDNLQREMEKSDEPDWIRRAPFRLLGHNRGSYYFLPRGTGQIASLAPHQMDRASHLYTIAPHAYWESHFPSKNGADWKAAADALIQYGHRSGIFLPEKMRGRGCWPEDAPDGTSGTVLHLGDRMIVPGSKQYVDPESYVSPTGHTYEAQGRMRGPSKDLLTAEEGSEILRTLRMLLWSDEASGTLLAGWVALAPVCGAIKWRPHVWLVGERGSGKTTVLQDIIRPLAGGAALYVQGETTEAGIRHELGTDAFPVIFDEAEEGEGVGTRIQRVLALARQASSETDAQTLKGTAHGSSLQYRVRSMFCFASIGGAVHQEADKSRVSLLQLRGASQVLAEERASHWEEFQPRLMDIDMDTGRRLWGRTVHQLRSGMLTETVQVFRSAAAVVLGDQRTGDQYGTLFAGAWCMENDDVPDAMVARELVASENLVRYREDHLPEGMRAISKIIQAEVRVDTSNGTRIASIGELIYSSKGDVGANARIPMEDATRVLGRCGMAVEVVDGEYWLFIANQSEFITDTLKDTPYSRNIRTVVRGLPGVEPGPIPHRFAAGYQQRYSMVPMHLIERSDEP